jgi:MYXO-CTERM domain-containing protein
VGAGDGEQAAGGCTVDLDGVLLYFAVVITDDPVVFEYSLPVEWQRDLSDRKRCPEDIVGEVHEDSKILSSALWSARAALPEAQREVLDRALVQAMAGFVDTDAYPDYGRKVTAEMRALAGDGPGDLVAAKLTEHGLDDCSGYLADLAPGVAWRGLFMTTFGGPRAPAPVQWRVTLPQAFDRIVVTIDDASAELPRGTMVVATKLGGEALRWDPDTVQSDGRPETAIGLIGARSSIIPGPFPAGPVVIQFVLAKPLLGLYLMRGIRFRGENAPATVDAGASPGADDGGGCAAAAGAGRGGGAWLLLGLLAAIAGRRRRDQGPSRVSP